MKWQLGYFACLDCGFHTADRARYAEHVCTVQHPPGTFRVTKLDEETGAVELRFEPEHAKERK